MKKNTIFLLFMFPILLVAQKKDSSKQDKIKALKEAFITEKLDLTSKEAKDFWSVYNKNAEIIHNLHRKELGKLRKEIREKKASITEQQAEEMLKKEIEINEKIRLANRKMDQELRKIISAKKLLILKESERQFYDKLIRKSQKK